MRITTHDSIDDIAPAAWNHHAGANPFLRHAFLAALERHGCVGAGTAWQPCHLAAWDGAELAGALPMYVKYDSWGEFVFDWSWARAFEHAGERYYPKLVIAVPFTPVTGPRLLIRRDHPGRAAVAQALLNGACDLAARRRLSSVHVLFNDADDAAVLAGQRWLERLGYQYHWHNRGYRDFADFLATFTAKKRKNVLRDRRLVRDAGIECVLLHGAEIDAASWETYYRFYASTMRRKGNVAALSRAFFEAIGATMPDNVMLIMARRDGADIGGALFLHDDACLYGRYWGGDGGIPGLHFEVCYYRPIEFCIARGLARFEAGAQGEHKIDRGFVPIATRSAHWIVATRLRPMIEDFLRHERRMIEQHLEATATLVPYKQAIPWASISNADPAARRQPP